MLQGVPIARAAEADQVVAHSPAHPFDEVVEHHTVEPTEQQGALAIPLQGETDVVDLAARQENADGIKVLQPPIPQQPSQALVAQSSSLGQAFQQSLGCSVPWNHTESPMNVQRGRSTAKGFTGQQLAVAVRDQQHIERGLARS